MRATYLFQYRVEFPPFANPPSAKTRFETELMAFLKARRLRVLMGQQGGCANTYGVVHRKRWGVKEKDRIALAEWIKVQRVRCTAKLGDLEEDTESRELVREITEWSFEVDNLTKEDRQAAAAYKREITKAFGPKRKSRDIKQRSRKEKK